MAEGYRSAVDSLVDERIAQSGWQKVGEQHSLAPIGSLQGIAHGPLPLNDLSNIRLVITLFSY